MIVKWKITNEEYENLPYERLVEIIDNKFNDFIENDLVKLSEQLFKLKGELK